EAERPLPEDAQPIVLHLVEDRRGPVGGAIVDDEELEVVERLREHALERLAQEPLPVANGQDYADARSHPLMPRPRAARAAGGRAAPARACAASSRRSRASSQATRAASGGTCVARARAPRGSRGSRRRGGSSSRGRRARTREAVRQ